MTFFELITNIILAFSANENKLSDEEIKKMIDNGSPQIFISDVSEIDHIKLLTDESFLL